MSQPRSRKNWFGIELPAPPFLRVVAIILLVLFGFTLNRLRCDLRSYALLTHFIDPNASGTLLNWEIYAVATEEISIPTANGPARGRLYLPMGVPRPRGMVAVPGIHRLGIDEPRLVSFAHAVAGSGLAVPTPQLDALADYHVDAASISTISESAVWLDRRLNEGL